MSGQGRGRGRGRDYGSQRGGLRGSKSDRGHHQQQPPAPPTVQDPSHPPDPRGQLGWNEQDERIYSGSDVNELENQRITNIANKMANLRLADVKQEEYPLPPRPGYGTEFGRLGRTFALLTNHFHLLPKRSQVLYRYSVVVSEEISKRRKKRLFRLLFAQIRTDGLKGVQIATDYAQIMITTERLPFEKKEYKIVYHDEDEPPFPAPAAGESKERSDARGRRAKTIVVSFDTVISLVELLKYLESSSPLGEYDKENAVQALNIITNKHPQESSNVAVIGGNKFFPISGPLSEKKDLNGGLQAFRGYYSSVRTSVGRVLLNVNVAAAAFYTPGPLTAIMEEWDREYRDEPMPASRLDAFLSGLRVKTRYIRAKDEKGKDIIEKGVRKVLEKTKTISGIARIGHTTQGSSDVLFDWDQGNGQMVKTSVTDYFWKAYRIRLKRPDLPCLNCGNDKNPVWVPPELCEVVRGQPAGQALSANQTTTMRDFAAREPHQNVTSINTTGLRVLGLMPDQATIRALGSLVNVQMLSVQARRRGAPGVLYRGVRIDKFNEKGNWDLRNRRFHVGAQLKQWAFLIINKGARQTIPHGTDVPQVLRQIKTNFGKYGMQVDDCKRVYEIQVDNFSPEEVDNKLGKEFTRIAKDGIKFLFVILPDKHKRLYSRIRLWTDVQVGILHQCLQAGETKSDTNFKGTSGIIINRYLDQYLGNVALKVNLKLGGINQTLDPRSLPKVDDNTIMFGLDVTHPSPSSSKGAPSIAAIVASVDKYFAQWPGNVFTQGSGVEIAKGRNADAVDELQAQVRERLRLWSTRNRNQLPTKVIVFRDGVSEGQYKQVLDFELDKFYGAFTEVYGNRPKPRLTVIVVGKRHNTRFYPDHKDTANFGATNNPPHGTVVDREITGERTWDFFVQAHTPLQATARPAHYVVLRDEIGFTANELETMIHSMAYQFGRATLPVSIVPGAYYADILAEKGRAYLHGELNESNKKREYNAATAVWSKGVHPNIKNTMFYI